MKRKIRIIKVYFKQSLMELLEYKQNFVIWVVIDALWTLLDGIFAVYLMTNINQIGSWDIYKMLILTGTLRILVFPIWTWILPSFAEIPKIVNTGKLDLYLTKPMSSQFLVSIHKFAFNHISSLIGGLIFLFMGFKGLGFLIWPNIIFGIWMFIVSLVLIYGVFFLTMSLIFTNDRTENLHQLFSEIFYTTGRYPRDIYAPLLQRILISFFPIVLMVTVPAQVLFGEYEPWMILWFHILTVVFFVVSRLAWKNGLKKYSSASS